jgi:hypothetical protein
MPPFGRQVFAPKLRSAGQEREKFPPEVLRNIFRPAACFGGALEFANVSAAQASLAEGPIAHCSN